MIAARALPVSLPAHSFTWLGRIGQGQAIRAIQSPFQFLQPFIHASRLHGVSRHVGSASRWNARSAKWSKRHHIVLPLLSKPMPRACHVVHRLPGRIRLNAPEAKGDRAFLHQVRQRLASADGVREVDANPLTGSIVVRYDKNEQEIEKRLQKAFQEENALLSMVVPHIEDVSRIASYVESDVTVLAKHSRIAAALILGARTLNLYLKRATNNAVDLKLLFPLAFASLSLFLIDRRREPGLWIMLLFVSVHTFLTLHQPIAVLPQKPPRSGKD